MKTSSKKYKINLKTTRKMKNSLYHTRKMPIVFYRAYVNLHELAKSFFPSSLSYSWKNLLFTSFIDSAREK